MRNKIISLVVASGFTGSIRVKIILLALIAGLFGFAYANGGFSSKISAPHIAKIRIEGTITEDERLMALLKEAAEEGLGIVADFQIIDNLTD